MVSSEPPQDVLLDILVQNVNFGVAKFNGQWECKSSKSACEVLA